MLAQADIVICHGGSGTVGQALAADVPLALVPLFADQPHNARRITALGAGVAVWQARPKAIAYAATEVLANPRHRTARSCGG